MKIRVLLVDDEASFVEYLGKRLAARGMEVATVGSGEAAIEEAKQRDHDVVVLDVKMPGLSGVETLRVLKQLRPRWQVIMLTGHASIESGVEGMKLGAFDYLVKPCDIEVLTKAINEAYAQRPQGEPTPPHDR
jgi:DNA-binding NtrC family response regulator